MAKMRRIMALVLVMAMTFSMLPVFAGAEDVVSEIPAVETVEAPAAEPVAEAPAAEAPADAPAADVPVVEEPVVEAPVVEEPVAVEDIVDVPAETPVEVPVVEAIETVESEAVAELQEEVTDPVAIVYPLIKDATGRLVRDVANGEPFATLQDAFTEARTSANLTEILVTKNIVFVNSGTAKTNFAGVFGNSSTMINSDTLYPTWDDENTSDLDFTVKGFWLDLGGNTLTFNDRQPAFYIEGSVPLNIKNGTIIFGRNGTSTGNLTNKPVIKLGYANGQRSATATGGYQRDGAGGKNSNPTVTLKNMKIYRVANDTTSTGATGGTTANLYFGAIIENAFLESTVNIINSELINDKYNVFYFKKSAISTGVTYPEGETSLPYKHYINVYGSSVIGTAFSDTAHESYTALSSVIYSAAGYKATSIETGPSTKDNDIELNVYGADAKLFGASGIFNAALSDGPSCTMSTPLSASANQDYLIPNVADIAAITEASVGQEAPAVATKVSGLTYTAAHVHNKVLMQEDAATCSTTGLAAHYYCEGCAGYFTAEDANVETTRAALVLGINPNNHAELVKHEVVPVSIADDGLATDGQIEHYTCESCGKYFDSEKKEITADQVIVKCATLPHEKWQELDVVAIAIEPDGETVHAYKGTTAIKAAIAYALSAWNEKTKGGVVKLVRDYVLWDSNSVSYTTGALFTTTKMTAAADYLVADNAEYKQKYGIDINGFWLDLGGHDLVVRSGYGLVTGSGDVPVNIRNGRLIHQFSTAQTGAYATFKHGSSSGIETKGGPRYTFDHVQLIGAKGASNNGSQFFYINSLQSTINVIHSKVIADRSSTFISYGQGTNVKTASDNGTNPYKHEVNVFGECVIGATAANAAVFKNSATATENLDDGIYLNIAEGADVKFLGTTLTEFTGTVQRKDDFVNKKFSLSSEAFTDYTMPNHELIKEIEATGPVTVVDLETTVSCSVLEEVDASADTTSATFTPTNGSESSPMSLFAAFKAWEENDYSGTITLQGEVTEEQANIIGGLNGASVTTYGQFVNEGKTYTQISNPLYLIDEDASNGSLTLDLKDYPVGISTAFLATSTNLSNFDLTVRGGTVTATGIDPIFILHGSDVDFKLDGAKLTRAENAASTMFGHVINDTRYGNSYSILTDSTLDSKCGAAIALVALPSNVNDASMLYYIKDCNLSGTYVKTYSPRAICTLSAVNSKESTITERPAVSVILDGTTTVTTVVGDDTTSPTNLAANELATITALEEGKTPVATTEYQTGETAIVCASLSEALKAAELFARNSNFYGKVQLQDNAVVEEPVAMGAVDTTVEVTLDLNSKMLTAENGVVDAANAAGTKVTINVTGNLGEGQTELNILKRAGAYAYPAVNKYVIAKDNYFENYSLNLNENVWINLYTDTNKLSELKNGKVFYERDGVASDPLEVYEFTETVNEVEVPRNRWSVKELSAKQMEETIDAYAYGKNGSTVYLDFSKNVSISNYAKMKPTETKVQTELDNTLDAMMIYGEYAKRFFANNYAALTTGELAEVLVINDAAPAQQSATDIREITGDKFNAGASDPENPQPMSFYGTSAVLADTLHLKFYFYDQSIANVANAKIAYAIGENAEFVEDTETDDVVVEKQLKKGTEDYNGYITAKIGVTAAEYDKPISVKLTYTEGGEEKTVTVKDSIASYAARIIANGAPTEETKNEPYYLAQAMVNYGAYASIYADAKTP